MFLGLQAAHDTLSNEAKRRAYDSQNDFDDSIPSGNEKGDFYEIYGPVFHSNGRFAVKVPVPILGDAETSDEEMFAFYEYWEKFESWRDFSLAGKQEHDPETADSREEKRWMIKENMKGVKNMKKKDNTRLITLVDRARTRDPRVKRALEREKVGPQQAKRQTKKNNRRCCHRPLFFLTVLFILLCF